MTATVTVGGGSSVDLEALAPVYAVAFLEPPYSEPDDAGLRRRLPSHRRLPGFALATAQLDGQVVGFSYGLTARHDDWWAAALTDALGPHRADEVLADCFELVELAVAPAARGCGLGSALLRALLRDRSEQRALLATHDGPTAAMRLYEREGFSRLAPLPLGVAMTKELP